MAGWAQTIIIGNVGRDPETRTLANGDSVASFSVAVTRTWNDKNGGGKKEKTVWYRVTAWRQLGQTAAAYVRKGMQIMVAGEMEASRAYLDNSGNPAAQLELTAQNFQFLGSRNDHSGAGVEEEAGDMQQGQTDDIPF